jgi:hypothetical protein
MPFFEMLARHLTPRRANGRPLLGGVVGSPMDIYGTTPENWYDVFFMSCFSNC